MRHYSDVRRLAAALLFASLAAAQTFEAASVKLVTTPSGPYHFTITPNRLDVLRANLLYLIGQAWDLYGFQISAPESLGNRTFEIQATSGNAVSKDEMRMMLRNLLIERFALVTHWETREDAVFRLQALPGGPKMKPAETGYASPNSPMRDGNTCHLNGPISMRQLAASLRSFAGKPVLDETNVDGFFTIDLAFACDSIDPAKDPSTAPPLAAAVEKQLGLRLVSGKAELKHLIVDHVNPLPSGN